MFDYKNTFLYEVKMPMLAGAGLFKVHSLSEHVMWCSRLFSESSSVENSQSWAEGRWGLGCEVGFLPWTLLPCRLTGLDTAAEEGEAFVA